MTIYLSIIFALILLAGCEQSGPASTRTNSSKFTTVAERADYLHKYVAFRHTYETLDFDIWYQNNGEGMVPGPSDWDVSLVATVPASELEAWIPQGVQPSSPDRKWLSAIPTSINVSGIDEWYSDGPRIVGIDRQHRIVAYRNSTFIH